MTALKKIKKLGTAISRATLKRDWYRDAVGGMWERMGKLQFDFLRERGLRPEHYLLDVGCGSLRGGIHFIRHLEPGHYFGIDSSTELLSAGRAELKRNGLAHKRPVLARMEDFDFKSLQQTFDWAIAQSVFTHLPINSIMRCISNMEGSLAEGGRFYATFFDNPNGKLNLAPILHHCDDKTLTTFFDKDPYHYSFETFQFICQGSSLKVECLGDWGHPRDQQMMVFIKNPILHLSTG